MILTSATTPDEYIECLISWQRGFAQALRDTVRSAVPDLEPRLKPGGKRVEPAQPDAKSEADLS